MRPLSRHDSAKELISQIEEATDPARTRDAKVTVLGEYIKHHVMEEQTEMFPKARKTKLDLRALRVSNWQSVRNSCNRRPALRAD